MEIKKKHYILNFQSFKVVASIYSTEWLFSELVALSFLFFIELYLKKFLPIEKMSTCEIVTADLSKWIQLMVDVCFVDVFMTANA